MNAPLKNDRDITVTVTVAGDVARELIAKAGLGLQDDVCWALRNGRSTTSLAVALTDALVKIAEED
ncbi:MAG: hypothetical protein ACYCX7_00450 [Solirubrobacteraceae bacterium]